MSVYDLAAHERPETWTEQHQCIRLSCRTIFDITMRRSWFQGVCIVPRIPPAEYPACPNCGLRVVRPNGGDARFDQYPQSYFPE